MNNYPPGVTGNEPRIAGVRHYRDCPCYEDYEFSDADAARIDPYEVKALADAAALAECPAQGHSHWPAIKAAIRPFLWLLECRCDEISAERREDKEAP